VIVIAIQPTNPGRLLRALIFREISENQ
jgi:hypothetical protein